ncbi:MAG: hypothetical protein AAGG07_14475 [Planctomycetota bacterium]
MRGGLKLKNKDGSLPTSWASQRWARLIEAALSGDEAVEALEYAKLGQTKKMTVENGVVRASVQGRATRPYQITLEFRRFSDAQWSKIIQSMAAQAVHTAKLLSGELPPNIEDLFVPLGLTLFPTNPVEVQVATTCPTMPEPLPDGRVPWPKHAGCAAYLLADRLDEDPFLIFKLRGMDAEDLLERIRQQRTLSTLGDGAAPVFAPAIPGATDIEPPPLEATLERFWSTGPELESIETPVTPPVLSHPLLRRLGQSPFEGGRFPLVGLLATCYELIGTGVERDAMRAIEEVMGGEPEPATPEQSSSSVAETQGRPGSETESPDQAETQSEIQDPDPSHHPAPLAANSAPEPPAAPSPKPKAVPKHKARAKARPTDGSSEA